jgi:hypothetical protein
MFQAIFAVQMFRLSFSAWNIGEIPVLSTLRSYPVGDHGFAFFCGQLRPM